jgi:diaminopimelate epimerase
MPLKTFTLPLLKAVATGNDFLLVDLLEKPSADLFAKEFARLSRPDWVKLWCDRYNGVGADGAVFLEPSKDGDFLWDFYNSDGSAAELCGNAARAVALYYAGKTGRMESRFQTRAGLVQAHVHSADEIEVELPAPKEHRWDQQAKLAGTDVRYDFVWAGVPHAVVSCDDLREMDRLGKLALELRSQSVFKNGGTNVTFIKVVDRDHIESMSFERGVDGFTLSCGTGAVAAAFVHRRGRDSEDLQVSVPGGRLNVVFKDGRPRLSGPARLIARVHWSEEDHVVKS